MVTKCSKTNLIYIVILAIACICAGILSYFKFDSTSAAILVSIPPMLVLLRFWMTVGRTIVMTEEGCTIKFLGTRKTYKWDELKTKQIVDFYHCHGMRQPYIKGAIFSPMYIKNPFHLMPLEYNSFYLWPTISLFGYFFVHFDPHLEGYDKDLHPDIFVVEESEFRKYMAEWNVDIEDTTKTMSSSKR